MPALPDKFESCESATCSHFETIFSNRIATNLIGPAMTLIGGFMPEAALAGSPLSYCVLRFH